LWIKKKLVRLGVWFTVRYFLWNKMQQQKNLLQWYRLFYLFLFNKKKRIRITKKNFWKVQRMLVVSRRRLYSFIHPLSKFNYLKIYKKKRNIKSPYYLVNKTGNRRFIRHSFRRRRRRYFIKPLIRYSVVYKKRIKLWHRKIFKLFGTKFLRFKRKRQWKIAQKLRILSRRYSKKWLRKRRRYYVKYLRPVVKNIK